VEQREKKKRRKKERKKTMIGQTTYLFMVFTHIVVKPMKKTSLSLYNNSKLFVFFIFLFHLLQPSEKN